MNKKFNMYIDSLDVWHVTTEGDVEGRTIKELGTHEGHIDSIAFALADKVCYSLTFKPATKLIYKKNSKIKKVNITLDINTGTWSMSSSERIKAIAILLKDRPVTITESNYYGSVTLQKKLSEYELKEDRKTEIKDALLETGITIEEIKKLF